MQATNRAGNLKRMTTHPNKKRRQQVAKEYVAREPKAQLAHLNATGLTAVKERAKLLKKLK